MDKHATTEYASQYESLLSSTNINPPSFARTLSQDLTASVTRSESLSLQQAIQNAMRYLDPYDNTRTGDFYGRAEGAVATNASLGMPPDATTTALNTFNTGITLDEQVKMTSNPQRGNTGGSLEDLCHAAGLYREESPSISNSTSLKQQKSPEVKRRSQEIRLVQEWENVKKLSNARQDALKLGKNDQSLVDDSDDDDVHGPIASLSKRKVEQVGNTHVEQSAAKRMAVNGSPAVARGLDLNRGTSFARDIHAVLDRGHSLALSDISLDRPGANANGGFALTNDHVQFDELADEDNTPALNRGLTTGTIHTFSE